MRCHECGTELRPLAHFCRNCGVPVDQPQQRLTVALPRPSPPTSEKAVILPIDENLIERDPTHTENLESSYQAVAADHLPGVRRTVPPGDSVRTGPVEMRDSLPDSGMLRAESEAKPFFTSVIDRPDGNPQHKRLVSVIPLLILAVILLFIFAYIAAK